MTYTYVIERGNDGSFNAYVPDLPGCMSCGDTLDELRTNIADAVALYVDTLRDIGQPIPAPGAATGVVEAA